MRFWEIRIGPWSTAHFVYNSGRSTGGPKEAQDPLLFLDQTEAAPKGLKIFWGDALHPLSQGLNDQVALPLPLSKGLDPPLYNIATIHLCLQSLCLPCGPCRGKILRYFEPQNFRLALCFFSG